MFESIGWEAIIVDECQRSKISSHFEQIKMLITDMRLLLVSGQLKVWFFVLYCWEHFPLIGLHNDTGFCRIQ